MSLSSLSLMHQPAASHFSFWIIKWIWPNIAFWLIGLVIFFIGAYARMPSFIEIDKKTRKHLARLNNRRIKEDKK